jgi:hypothetical protein
MIADSASGRPSICLVPSTGRCGVHGAVDIIIRAHPSRSVCSATIKNAGARHTALNYRLSAQ